MKAVNLIPEGDRPGGGSAAGRSGGAVYGVLGALAVLVLVVSMLAVTGKQISDREAEAAQLRSEAQAAQQKVSVLSPYREFRTLAEQRVSTVTGLMNGRFDWAHALREVSRVVPSDAWMTSLTGTVAPGVSVGSGSGGGGGGREAVDAPAIEVLGCVPDLARVATLMARMRTIDGVDKVTLGTSEKNDTSSTAPTGADQSDCRQGSDRVPQFNIVVFFKPVPGLVAPNAAAPQEAQPGAAAQAASAPNPDGGAK
jgi:Tfp pilus assembly protein PilN